MIPFKLNDRSFIWKTLLFISLGCVLSLIFFYQVILSSFREFTGDTWDTRIEIAILEHWKNVLLGYATWNSPSYFYPTPGVLGYNDGYFVYGLIYSLFRSIGFDWFQSYELVNLVLKWIGYAGFVWVAIKIFNIRFVIALIGGAVFFLLNSTYVQVGHAQLLTLNFLPVMIGIGYSFIKSFDGMSSLKILLWGLMCILFYSSWLITSFYTAYFSFLILLIGVLIYSWLVGKNHIIQIARNAKERSKLIAILILLLVIVNIPFFIVYLPKALETGMWSTSTIYFYALTPIDVLNVGPGNWIYGGFIDQKLRGGEWETGFTPFLLALFTASLFYTFYNWKKCKFYVSILLAVLFLWVASIRFGDFLLWNIIFYLPGAKGIRTISRFQMVVGFFIILNSIILLNLFYINHRFKSLVIMLSLVVLLEQLNLSDRTNLKVDDESWIFSVSAPPDYCKSFFIIDPKARSNGPPLDDFAANIDGMILSQYFRIPTINGWASFTPHDWVSHHPYTHGYILKTWLYAEEKGILQGLCGLDIPANRWIDLSNCQVYTCGEIFLNPYALGSLIRFDSNHRGVDYLIAGWSSSERWGTWSVDDTASIGLRLPAVPKKDLILTLEGYPFMPSNNPSQKIDVIINHVKLLTLEFREYDDNVRTINIPVSLVQATGGAILIELDFKNANSPKALDLSSDKRKLGLGIVAVKLQEQP